MIHPNPQPPPLDSQCENIIVNDSHMYDFSENALTNTHVSTFSRHVRSFARHIRSFIKQSSYDKSTSSFLACSTLRHVI